MPPEVYFDEAGNTGAALLDAEQPVFTLASVDFTLEEATYLLDLVRTPQTREVKFTALRRSRAGQDRLLRFLSDPLLEPARVRLSVTHKRYMVVCKAVDLIEETLAHEAGIDLYHQGANIAIANLHYYVTPLFCGQDRFDTFLSTFVQMVRTQTPDAKVQFFAATRALYVSCTNERHRSSLGPYLMAERQIDDILDGVDYTALDPAIGAVFHQLGEWGRYLQRDFHAIHDASKPIAAERETFKAMMNPDVEATVIGYDRRKFEFPLRTRTLEFGDSRDLPQLQVADLLAGSISYFASALAREARDDLTNSLERAGIERYNMHVLWPAPQVTPKALGTEESGGINAANFMAVALAKTRI